MSQDNIAALWIGLLDCCVRLLIIYVYILLIIRLALYLWMISPASRAFITVIANSFQHTRNNNYFTELMTPNIFTCFAVFVQLLCSCQGRLVVHLIRRWSGNFCITALTLFQSVSYLLSRGYLRKVYNPCLVPPMAQLMHMATRYQSQWKVLCFLELAGLCTCMFYVVLSNNITFFALTKQP